MLSTLARELRSVVGEDRVFHDRETLEGGDNWRERLREEIGRCSVFLAIIGREWLQSRDPDSGQRRLDDPGDWVRVEIELALDQARTRRLLIAPVLVDDARMPGDNSKLPTLQGLFECQSFRLRTGTGADWDADVKALIAALEKKGAIAGTTGEVRPPPAWLEPHLTETIERFERHMVASRRGSGAQGQDPYLELMVTERRAEPSSPNSEGNAAKEARPLRQAVETAVAPLLIVGEGGAGKTTSLLCFAARAADRARTDPTAPIPVYANLAHLTTVEDVIALQRLVADAVSPVRDWEELVASAIAAGRRFLFLFDSFNEVPEHLQRNCAVALVRFVQKQRERHACLVASRMVPQVEQLAVPASGFMTLELLRLTRDQVREFLMDRGLGALHERMSSELRDLAGNPFMLHAVARSLAGVKEEALPRNRGQLYQSFVWDWIDNEDRKRTTHRYSYERVKQPLLSHLAKRMTADGQTSLPVGDELAQDIKRQLEDTYKKVEKLGGMPGTWTVDECLGEVLDDGLLKRTGSRLYFMHQSLQEYFTGLYFARVDADALVEFTPKLAWKSVSAYSLEEPPSHRLVPALLMMTGLVKDASSLVEALVSRHPILAAAVIRSAARVDGTLIARLEQEWLDLLEDAVAARRNVGCACLALAGMASGRIIGRLVRIALTGESQDAGRALDVLSTLDAREAVTLEVVGRSMEMTEDASESEIATAIRTLQSDRMVRVLFERWRASSPDSPGRDRAGRLLATIDRGLLGAVLDPLASGGPAPIAVDARAALDAAESSDGFSLGSRLRRALRKYEAAKAIRGEALAQTVAGMADAPEEVLVAALRSDDAVERSTAARVASRRRIPVGDAIVETILRMDAGWETAELVGALVGLYGEEGAVATLRERAKKPCVLVGTLTPDVGAALQTDPESSQLSPAFKAAITHLGVSDDLRLRDAGAGDEGRVWMFEGRRASRYMVLARAEQWELHDCNIRSRALAAIAEIAGEAALSELRSAVLHSEPETQVVAIRALSRRGDETLGPMLLSKLRTETARDVVSAALSVLAQLRIPAAFQLLEDLLSMTADDFSDVHPVWGPSRSQPGWGDQIHSIMTALECDEDVRRGLEGALRSTEPARRAAAATEWTRWLSAKDLSPERHALWRLPEDVEQLLTIALRDEDEDVRKGAIRALINLKTEVGGTRIASHLDDADVEVRLAAASVLVDLQLETAYQRLSASMLELARSSVPLALRQRAAAVLTKLPEGAEPFYQPIQDALEGNWLRALQLADDALLLLPDDVNLHWWRGHALRQLGRLPEAVDSFRRASELKGSLAVIRQTLAETFLELKDYPHAVAAAKLAAEIEPSDADCQSVLAWSSFHAGAFDDALAAAEIAIALDPVHMGAIWVALLVHLQRRDLPAARSMYAHAKRVKDVLAPTCDPALAARVRGAIAAVRADEPDLARLVKELEEIVDALQETRGSD